MPGTKVVSPRLPEVGRGRPLAPDGGRWPPRWATGPARALDDPSDLGYLPPMGGGNLGNFAEELRSTKVGNVRGARKEGTSKQTKGLNPA